jgi:DNA-binding transcriptional LysR family regulator
MMPDYRVLSHKTEKPSKVLCKTHITVNSVVAMTHLCINGLGLATPPASMVEMELSKGLLVEPLSDWSTEPIPYYALWPNNITPNINAKHFLKFIGQANTN